MLRIAITLQGTGSKRSGTVSRLVFGGVLQMDPLQGEAALNVWVASGQVAAPLWSESYAEDCLYTEGTQYVLCNIWWNIDRNSK